MRPEADVLHEKQTSILPRLSNILADQCLVSRIVQHTIENCGRPITPHVRTLYFRYLCDDYATPNKDEGIHLLPFVIKKTWNCLLRVTFKTNVCTISHTLGSSFLSYFYKIVCNSGTYSFLLKNCIRFSFCSYYQYVNVILKTLCAWKAEWRCKYFPNILKLKRVDKKASSSLRNFENSTLPLLPVSIRHLTEGFKKCNAYVLLCSVSAIFLYTMIYSAFIFFQIRRRFQ